MLSHQRWSLTIYMFLYTHIYIHTQRDDYIFIISERTCLSHKVQRWAAASLDTSLLLSAWKTRYYRMLFQLFFIIQENKGIICYVHVLSTQVGILHGHQPICIYGWGEVGNSCVFLKGRFSCNSPECGITGGIIESSTRTSGRCDRAAV